MNRPDIERFIGGVMRARDKGMDNPVLRDFEETLIWVKHLEAAELERVQRDPTYMPPSAIDGLEPVDQLPWTGNRIYRCPLCGWRSPEVVNGEALRALTKHLCPDKTAE